MTQELFREDSYIRECDATVVAIDDGAVILDRTIFYPLGGGQPGDTGEITCAGGKAMVVDTRYGDGGTIRHVVEENSVLPEVGLGSHFHRLGSPGAGRQL